MKKRQFLVVGLGRFGSAVAQSLYESGIEVMAIDQDPELVDLIQHHVTHAAQADSTDRDALSAISAGDFDTAIVTIGSDIRASGITVMHLKEMGVKTVVAKAYDDLHGRMLTKLGADKVVFPERDMGRRVAHNLVSENILDFIEISPEFSLSEMSPLPDWCGYTIGELGLRAKHGLNVVAVMHGGQVNGNVRPDTVLHDGDVMLVMAGNGVIGKFSVARG